MVPRCGYRSFTGRISTTSYSGHPSLIILCVSYLEDCRANVTDIALQMLAITAACLACFNLFLALSASTIATRVGSVATLKKDPVLTFLDQHITRGEEIFTYPYCPMYYFLSAATNPTRYSILLYNYNTPSQFRESHPGLGRTPGQVRGLGQDFSIQSDRRYLLKAGLHAR